MIGRIFDIKKFAVHDGPGIRTTVFLTGCPLSCPWCHNPEGRGDRPTENLRCFDTASALNGAITSGGVESELVLEELAKDELFYAQSGGGVTFSGGEPLVQPDFLVALLAGCRERRYHTAVDTCGYAEWKALDEILESVDLFLYDIKFIDDDMHEKYTGVSNKAILENMKRLLEEGASVNPRIPLIPGITDTRNNLEDIARFLQSLEKDLDVSVLPYNKIGEDKFRRLGVEYVPGPLSSQTTDMLDETAGIFRQAGFSVRIGG